MAAFPNSVTNITFSTSPILHVLTNFDATAKDTSRWIAKGQYRQIQHGIVGG
jgi:hypothetical protein